MAEKMQKKDRKGVDKKSKKSSSKSTAKNDQIQKAATSAFNLLANNEALNPALSSLFAVKQPPVKAKPVRAVTSQTAAESDSASSDDDENGIPPDEVSGLPENIVHTLGVKLAEDESEKDSSKVKRARKRKREDADEDLEAAYLQRLAREEVRDNKRLVAERQPKGAKSTTPLISDDADSTLVNSDDEAEDDAAGTESDDSLDQASEADDTDGDEDAVESDAVDATGNFSPPPRHETEVAADIEVSKANCTVFLGNVSSEAISSKASRKTLLHHLQSFFDAVKAPKEGEAKHKVESIRFRSTAYASAIPKKASFAKKELMDATTKSTNAYAVYSSPMLAREAAKRLNGTVVLNRHLRVDQVAHPAAVDHKRCVFVGNLGFVDDESNILLADDAEGREKRKPGKQAADIDEGLWRTFGKCGAVESVRVVRDSTTRVGKGIAYVQFADENAVEAALLFNDKKFPPMLPRKLRVSRARAQKRKAKAAPAQSAPRASSIGYQRKITAEEASNAGRAGKMLGRAAAARVRQPDTRSRPSQTQAKAVKLGDGIKKPESFVFEGHRASAKQGKTGLKLGGRSNKKTKVTKRSASYRATKRKA